jgi:ASCH domain
MLVGMNSAKIISIRQPWASLIVLGFKDVENRTWPTRYRGPALVHAAKRVDDVSLHDIERRFGVRLNDDLPLGGVVGITNIRDCVRPHPSVWYAPAHYAFVLANSRPLPFASWKGALGLRDAPSELLERLALDDASGFDPSNGRELDAA